MSIRPILVAATAVVSLAGLSLTACGERARAPDPEATTGAGGAYVRAGDPNPTGEGAMTGATPGDATGSMGSTAPDAAKSSHVPQTLPEPEVSNMPTPAEK